MGEHAEHEKVEFEESTKNPLLQVHDLSIIEALSAQDVHWVGKFEQVLQLVSQSLHFLVEISM